MEANFFRSLAREIGRAALGRRIEKIFAPADDAWTFRLDSRGEHRYLMFRPAKSAGLFFFTDQKPLNPATPPARVMWYRKRVAGRRILAQAVDWPGLRLAWELSPREQHGHGRFLVFSMRDDLRLADELDPAFGAEPGWPPLARAMDEDAWKDHPHLSPPLRRALAALPEPEAAELYERMQSGAASGFFLPAGAGALPLPWKTGEGDLAFPSALEATTAHGERVLFPSLERQELSPERARLKRARKRLRRALARLDEEQRTLDERRALQLHGEALQAEFYRFRGMEETPASVRAAHPVHGELEIALDRSLSLSANMERFFKLAAKAERGYAHLARRRNELGKEMARVEAGSASLAEPAPAKGGGERAEAPGQPAPPKRYRGMAVSLFRSSDGMLIVRGRNKKANHDMLSKAASPFDWWLHAAQGPSSHVILKRDHPGQRVPERTLLEAAALCALKSHARHGGKAEIMFALVRDVRKVKGWDHGRVAVDEVLGSVLVLPEEGIEERLAWEPAPSSD
jgi:hypothetical protein